MKTFTAMECYAVSFRGFLYLFYGIFLIGSKISGFKPDKRDKKKGAKMGGKSKLLFVTAILLFCFSFTAFGQYADLVGKWVRINGPQGREHIGFAYDEHTCDKLITAYHYGDEEYIDNLLESFDVLVIKNYTSAILLDSEIFEGRAKVALLSNRNTGVIGWIPIEWLDNNEERPLLHERDKWLVGKFRAPGTDHLWKGYIRKDKML